MGAGDPRPAMDVEGDPIRLLEDVEILHRMQLVHHLDLIVAVFSPGSVVRDTVVSDLRPLTSDL